MDAGVRGHRWQCDAPVRRRPGRHVAPGAPAPQKPDVMTPAATQSTPSVPAQPKPHGTNSCGARRCAGHHTHRISCAGRTAKRYRQRRRRKITQITTMATAVPTNDHLVSPSLYGTHTMAVRSKGSPPTGNEQQHDAIRNQRSAHRP